MYFLKIKLKNFFIFKFILLLIFLPVFFQNALADSATNFRIEIIPGPECYDGQDNDGDGLIDYPDDLGCDSTSDDDETDPSSCGDGVCNSGESCSNCPVDCGNCGEGGGGGIIAPITSVTFSGRAYPLNKVTLLKDGQIAITTIAGPDANFKISLTGLSAGNYIFSIYGEDSVSRRSTLFTFSVFITKGAITNISGIFIAPTIAVDKSAVKRGDNIAIFGQSIPNSEITIAVNSAEEFFVNAQADNDGIYLYNFDTAPLEIGEHSAKSKTAFNGEISSFSQLVSFAIGTETIDNDTNECDKADLNCDEQVNLVDFSIMLYWWEKDDEYSDQNNDGIVNLIDFSIMMYYWTG